MHKLCSMLLSYFAPHTRLCADPELPNPQVVVHQISLEQGYLLSVHSAAALGPVLYLPGFGMPLMRTNAEPGHNVQESAMRTAVCVPVRCSQEAR